MTGKKEGSMVLDSDTGTVPRHLQKGRKNCGIRCFSKQFARSDFQLLIPDHADQRSGRMPITNSGPWRSRFRTGGDH
jgi:hypothetical protein